MDASASSFPRPASVALVDFDPATLAQQFATWGYKPSHAARVLREFYAGGDIATSTARGLPNGLVELMLTAHTSALLTLIAMVHLLSG